MSRLLFTVADHFLIRGRGLVVLPGILPRGNERLRVGDPLLLKRPDGSVLSWAVGGIEMAFEQPYRPPSERPMPVLLTGLSKADVPIGTEVWSAASA